jgi:hypothetical protein
MCTELWKTFAQNAKMHIHVKILCLSSRAGLSKLRHAVHINPALEDIKISGNIQIITQLSKQNIILNLCQTVLHFFSVNIGKILFVRYGISSHKTLRQ